MSSPIRGASGKKKKKRQDLQTKARIRDIAYYLGEDWIDFTVITSDAMTNYYRNLCTTSYQPKKCPVCKIYWVNSITTSRGKLEPKELDKHFYNIPAEREKCWKC
jgi:hypothetical protein